MLEGTPSLSCVLLHPLVLVTADACLVSQMQDAESSFAGVSFHCYDGSVSDQQTFENDYPSKSIFFTECTGEYGSDWWSDIKVSFFRPIDRVSAFQIDPCSVQWYMDNM